MTEPTTTMTKAESLEARQVRLAQTQAEAEKARAQANEAESRRHDRAGRREFWGNVLAGVAVVIVIAIVIGWFSFMFYQSQETNRARTHRDQVVKTTCVQAGKTWLNGSCVRIAP